MILLPRSMQMLEPPRKLQQNKSYILWRSPSITILLLFLRLKMLLFQRKTLGFPNKYSIFCMLVLGSTQHYFRFVALNTRTIKPLTSNSLIY